MIKKLKKVRFLLLGLLCIFIPSVILGFHNATLYNPRHGFDGVGHVFYIEYLFKHGNFPPPNLNWETHQPPLYYSIGAFLMMLTGTWKIAQYINTAILWCIIGMVGLGLWKVFKKPYKVFIGMFALASLPMLNIFPAMITNELLNTFWIISSLVASIYLLSAKEKKIFFLYSIWLAVSLSLGLWTKMTIVTVAPILMLAYLQIFLNKFIKRKMILISVISVTSFVIIMSIPVLLRARSAASPSDITRQVTKKLYFNSPEFYYRLDWIPKVDMYTTQYYSLLGGAWNSFWSDGHNAITPFVKFHKKAFILWTLGFFLLPLSITGLIKMWKTNRLYAPIMYVTGIGMFLIYIYDNLAANHYSAVRLTYEMGIVVPYVFGLANISQNKIAKTILFVLIAIQFVTMISFFWIQSWWHVTK
ncbi:hypothetical protein HY041_00990 [Candidatus Roizmanbacteria bacterium]|nr:hypothetical protein [Candidatus Roizmanbacteria bacterium]